MIVFLISGMPQNPPVIPVAPDFFFKIGFNAFIWVFL